MSRPVSEPTTQRSVRGLGFSADQLFRRPAPASAGTFAWARFQRVDDTDITVLDETPKQIQGTAGSDVISDATIFQINSNVEIQLLVDGVVSVQGHTVWSTYDGTFRLVSVFNVTPSPDQGVAIGGISAVNFDVAMVGGVARVPAGAKLRLIVNQVSGGSQTLYGGGTDLDETNWLEVIYLGPYQP